MPRLRQIWLYILNPISEPISLSLFSVDSSYVCFECSEHSTM